jgi:putative tryptophan/tyrosine transport system substrate-binding protein
MKRREFIVGLGAATAWPLAARAQQAERGRRVGFLHSGEEINSTVQAQVSLFKQGLEELGWVEGRNLRIEHRWAAGNVERMPILARELVDLQPDVIVVNSSVATRMVQAQTRTIPIVFVYAGDPIASGLVTNISRPEGNTTGVTDLFPSIGGKWVQLLKEAVPSLARVALVFAPDFHNEVTVAVIEEAAARTGIKAIRIAARDGTEIAPALDAFAAEGGGGVIPVPPVLTLPRAIEIIQQAALRHQLPTIYNDRALPANRGGLMSYGALVADLFRRGCPDYVNRILRGAKPGDLPVQFSTKFELVINLKTAKAMGLTIPEAFLLRADEVIG